MLAPGVLAPGVLAPGVLAPGVLAPGVLAPGVLAPGVLAPGMQRIRAKQPDPPMPALVIDTRIAAPGLPGAVWIPGDRLEGWIGEVLRVTRSDLDRPLVVFHPDPTQALRGVEILRDAGFSRVRPLAVVTGEGGRCAAVSVG